MKYEVYVMNTEEEFGTSKSSESTSIASSVVALRSFFRALCCEEVGVGCG